MEPASDLGKKRSRYYKLSLVSCGILHKGRMFNHGHVRELLNVARNYCSPMENYFSTNTFSPLLMYGREHWIGYDAQ